MASARAGFTSTPITVWPFSAMTAAIGAPNFPKPATHNLTGSLLSRNRHSPARAEGARGNFQPRRRLFPLEFRAPKHPQHPLDGCRIITLSDDFLRRFALFHVPL